VSAYELDRQEMLLYRQQLAREASVARARKGTGLVYRPGGEHGFFRDLGRRVLHGPVDRELEQRLRDHGAQLQYHRSFSELRGLDATVGAGGSFAAPDHLQALFTAAAHPQRATANLCTHIPIAHDTAQIILPTLSSGSGVSVDSTQNSSIYESDPVDTLVGSATTTTTIAGMVTASRPLVDQASPASRVEDVIGSDIGAASGASLDAQVIAGSGSGGQMLGLMSTPNVVTVPGGDSVWGIAEGFTGGCQQMLNTRYQMPTAAVMHPRRWLDGFANAVTTTGLPVILPDTSPGARLAAVADSVVATWHGVPIVLDPQVPTDAGSGEQDYILLLYTPDLLLYESIPAFEAHMETLAGQLSVLYVARSYAALAVRYSTSVVLVGPFDPPTIQGS
jgi:HK97 family phage major capsid protein